MSKINITFEIDTNEPSDVYCGAAFYNFISIVYGNFDNIKRDIKYNTDNLPVNTNITNTVVKKKETRGRKTNTENEKKIIEAANVNVTDPSIKDVRFILAKKIDTNRNRIIEKIKSYGIDNINDLSKDYYAEFMEFLLSLK